jgi:hypothetical protein
MNEKEKLRYTLWECEMCGDEFLTDSEARHDMVWCKCKKTAVDAEEWYTRFIGKPKLICEGNTKPKQR